MDSEDESNSFKMEPRQPRKQQSAPKPKPRLSKLKNNRISSPEIESITDSGNSGTEKTSNSTDVFLVRSKPKTTPHLPLKPLKRTTRLISEDEISNISTLDDQTTSEQETSEDLKSPKQTSNENESKSYRDKLKERFRSVKQLSTKNLEKSSLKRFRQKSQDVINLNKCIANLRNDNHNVNLQLKAHKPYVYQGSTEVSSAEKYQFFVESVGGKNSWELHPNTNDNSDVTQDDNPENNENTIDRSIVINKRAENMKDMVEKSYEECVWTTKSNSLTHELELEARDLKEDGLFVAKPPKIPQRHLNQLKQRLLASENHDFFDSSGQIIFNESNYSPLTYRPDGYEDENPFELIYHKPTTIVPATMSSIVVNQSQPTLEINIQGFRFTNHPLFSPEHVLQEELIRHFDIHKEFRRTKKREKLLERLQTLRNSKNNISENFNENQEAGDATRNDLQASYVLLIKQIKTIREDFYKECKLYRENIKNVLHAWKALKKLRIDNNYSTTTIKLVITKHLDGFYDDPEVVLNELITEKEEEYQENLSIYKKELLMWKKQFKDDETIEDEKPIKPPRIVSTKKLRITVNQLIAESFGDETEPTISFTINYSNGITPSDQVNDEEKQRRNAVQNTKIRLKLLLNNILICKSKACMLNPNFTLNFDEVLSLKLLEYENATQDTIEVHVVEVHNLKITKNKLCSAMLPIPKLGLLIGQSDFKEVYFDCKQDSKLSGFLTFCIGWDSVENKTMISNILNQDGGVNVSNLKNWVHTSNPDPEDPRNGIIFDYLNDNTKDSDGLIENTKYFRCDPYLETFTICSKEDIENNVRLQLLRLRDNNEPEFVGMMVPNRLNEIPSNIFSTYKRRLADEKYQEYFDKEDEIDDDIISKRSLGRKYLRQIHTKVFQVCRNCENNLTFEDVIDEKMVPWIQNYLKTMLSNFFNWFKLQPDLTIPLPLLELRSEIDGINHDDGDGATSLGIRKAVKIVIQLKSGINLPTVLDYEKKHAGRKVSKSRSIASGGGRSGNSSANSERSTMMKEMPYFIEISYDNLKITSGLSQNSGKNPTWNKETLIVPLGSDNLDYLNPNSLNGSIVIHLFQQIDNKSEKETSDDVQGVCLGSVVVTIAAAASDVKLEGEFILKTPPFIYGYDKEEEIKSPSTPRTQLNKNINLSFLEMSIYPDSTVPKISADLSAIPCGEPPFIKDHVLDWNKRLNIDHPKRKFSALAIDTNGKTICLTRFIKALEPPKLNTDEFDVSLEQCARFVSLVPFSNVNKFYENVWLTAEQMLKLGIGSIYDHATLLTNYLLSLKLEVWLLIGFGIPHSNTAYVLLREYNETPLPNHFIIDVTNGIMWNVTDQYCPLKKVYCVVNENNIWANVQRGDAVFTTRFDFTRRFDWQALFNNSVSSPTNSVQHSLHYLQSGDAHKLQNIIEKKLIKKIANLRNQDVTIWNHYLSNLLKAQINKAEKNFMHSKTHITASNQIVEYSENFKISGSIQCLHFSSVNEIVDAVLTTKTWNVTGRNVEFATCVQVHAYVNQVIAVWVAFVSVVKK